MFLGYQFKAVQEIEGPVFTAMYLKLFVLLFVNISIASAKRLSLPSYIKRCSLSAPDFEDCCVKNGREAITFLNQGDSKYNFPSLSPLKIPFISLASGSGLNLNLTDVKITGLGNAVLQKIKFDLKGNRIHSEFYADTLEIIGKYIINGRILVIPIEGNGDINVTAVNCDITYDTDIKLVNRKGEDYIELVKGSSSIAMKRAYFELTNLYNGNEQLGMSTNKFINDEWEALIDSLRPVITDTIVSVGNRIINGVTHTVPLKEIFLE